MKGTHVFFFECFVNKIEEKFECYFNLQDQDQNVYKHLIVLIIMSTKLDFHMTSTEKKSEKI